MVGVRTFRKLFWINRITLYLFLIAQSNVISNKVILNFFVALVINCSREWGRLCFSAVCAYKCNSVLSIFMLLNWRRRKDFGDNFYSVREDAIYCVLKWKSQPWSTYQIRFEGLICGVLLPWLRRFVLTRIRKSVAGVFLPQYQPGRGNWGRSDRLLQSVQLALILASVSTPLEWAEKKIPDHGKIKKTVY